MKTCFRGLRIAITAAMKKVLSPISEARITPHDLKKPSMKRFGGIVGENRRRKRAEVELQIELQTRKTSGAASARPLCPVQRSVSSFDKSYNRLRARRARAALRAALCAAHSAALALPQHPPSPRRYIRRTPKRVAGASA
jgi:hypothetical protein